MHGGPICNNAQVRLLQDTDLVMGCSPLPEEIRDHSTQPLATIRRRTPSFVYTASVPEAKDVIDMDSDIDDVMSLRTLTDDDDEFRPLDEELRRDPQVRRSNMRR